MTLRSLSLLVSLALCTPLAAHAVDFTPQELARASTLQQRLLTLDSHLDTPANFHRAGFDITQRHDHNALSQVDYPRMVEGALDGGFWAIYTDQGDRSAQAHQHDRDAGLLRLTEIREMLAAHPDTFQLALTAADAAR
ncbi:MAG TPA: peptidase M19, partial [Stenotrophomonas sp.]|nr:peptidase M19 [Stenotrophomonas sp.]